MGKYIKIGASYNNAIGSKLIRWWMGTTYSHVYAKWYLTEQDRMIVYHASHGMVHFLEFNKFKKNNKTVLEFVIPLTQDQFVNFSKKCIDLAGEQYSKIELLQIFLSDATNGCLKFKDQKGYICSELVSELLENIGITFDKPKFLLRPDDIIKALTAKYA